MRRILVVLVALLSVSGRLQAQDSIPAPPDTSAVTPADSLVPGSLAGSPRCNGTVPGMPRGQ
jgi:hypothetical protein